MYMTLRKTTLEYDELGKSKGLRLMGAAPYSMEESAVWKCLTCDKMQMKSFRALRQAKYGCSCHDPRFLTRKDYDALAEKLGIVFSGEEGKIPPAATVPTWWACSDLTYLVQVSYRDLAYNRLSKKLKKLLKIC